MSTEVGTLQPAKARRSLWLAAVVLPLVLLTVAVVVFFSIDRGGPNTQAQQKESAIEAPAQPPQESVGGTANNTPSEQRQLPKGWEHLRR